MAGGVGGESSYGSVVFQMGNSRFTIMGELARGNIKAVCDCVVMGVMESRYCLLFTSSSYCATWQLRK